MPVLHWWGQDTQRPAVFCGTDEHGGVGPCSYQVLVVPGFSPEEMKQRVQTPTRVKNDSTHIFFPQNCSSISLCCHSTWPACWPPEQVSLLLWVPSLPLSSLCLLSLSHRGSPHSPSLLCSAENGVHFQRLGAKFSLGDLTVFECVFIC